tara:strand:- start:744 stop:1730 length:987 start_codon:yes stop_codon:yes gene_type:complete
MSHTLPCKGHCEKLHNGKPFFWSYSVKPHKAHSFVTADFLIQWDKNSVCHTIDKICVDSLDSKEGYKCNCRIKLDRSLSARVVRIWRIPKKTGPAQLRFEISWDCKLGKTQDYGDTIELLSKQLVEYLESVSTLSPSKIIDANIETGLGIFLGIIKIAAESKYIDPRVDSAIHSFCTHLIEHYDSELDNIILLGNKFTTNIQLFQERLEDVKNGSNWKDVFLHKDENTSHTKTDGYSSLPKPAQRVEICMNQPAIVMNSNTSSLPSKKTTKPSTKSNNQTIEYIRVVQTTYESIYGKEPSTDNLLYYVSILKKTNDIDNLKTVMLAAS